MRVPKTSLLNRRASAAYSPAISVIGERHGKQRAEAVEPGSQEAQAEKESSREAGDRQDADRETLKAGLRQLAREATATNPPLRAVERPEARQDAALDAGSGRCRAREWSER